MTQSILALTRSGHWVAACATMGVVVFILGGSLVSLGGGVKTIRQPMDSSSAVRAKQPPPAWMQRLYPQYSQAAANAKPSPVMVWMTVIFGVAKRAVRLHRAARFLPAFNM